jgi:hypothetical protein
MSSAELTFEMPPFRAVEQLERDFDLTIADLARALDASPRTIERWRTQGTYPQRDTRLRLSALLALDRRLRDTFNNPQAIRVWLHAPSRYLGGLTPADAIRVGRVDRVEAALEALDSGVFL